MRVARAWLVIGSLVAAGELGCNSPTADEPRASGAAPTPNNASGDRASPTPSPEQPPEPAPKPDPSLQLQVTRVYRFRGIGRGEGEASLLQTNLAESFTAGVSECVKQHGVRGRFGMMLLTKPDKGELEVNGVKGPTHVTAAFVTCTKAVYARAQMPEGERFDGMLMIDYEAK